MSEKAKFRKIPFASVPCRTYACTTMAGLSIGGSDAAQFEWHHLCLPCAVSLVESAFEIPELREVIMQKAAGIMTNTPQFHQLEPEQEPEKAESSPQKPEPKFPCSHCEFDAANSSGLSAHIRAKHPQDEALK